MPYQVPSYGGIPMFGLVTSFVMTPNPAARQIDAIFGQDGELSLYGGARGRTFQIAGVLLDVDIEGLNVDEGVILNTEGPTPQTLVDTRGNSWPNVVFDGEYRPDPSGPHPTDTGWCLAYRMTLHGLS